MNGANTHDERISYLFIKLKACLSDVRRKTNVRVHNKRKKGLERKMRSGKTVFKTAAWMLVEFFILEVILYKGVYFNVQTHCPLR